MRTPACTLLALVISLPTLAEEAGEAAVRRHLASAHPGWSAVERITDSDLAAVLPGVEAWIAGDPEQLEFTREDTPAKAVLLYLPATADAPESVREIADAAAVVALFRDRKVLAPPGDDEQSKRAAYAAVLLLRGAQAKAHADKLLPRSVASNDSENWWLREKYQVERKGDEAAVSGIVFWIGHAEHRLRCRFDAQGALAAVDLESTGVM